MRAINVVLAILVSLLMGLLVFEGGLRLIGMGPPPTRLEPHARLGWQLVPGMTGSRKVLGTSYTVDFAINSDGLRDDERPSKVKPDGAFRVVMLGDSFTQGFSVNRRDLFVDQLRHWWAAEGREVDVVNAGTEGYSTDQQVAWLLEHGDAYDPDLVLLFPYENDLYWNGQLTYAGGQAKPMFRPDGGLATGELAAPSEKPWTDKVATLRLFSGGQAPDESFLFTPAGGSRPILREFGAALEPAPEFMADAYARTEGALKALKTKCDELGAACVVAPIPSHSVVDADYAAGFAAGALGLSDGAGFAPDKPVDDFLRMSAAAGLETLDARSTLKALQRSGEDVYYQRDWHLNAAGNRAFASFLHDELDKLGALGDRTPKQVVAQLPTPPDEGGIPGWMKLFAVLWVALSGLYIATYRDEPVWQPPIKVGLLLSAVFAIVLGGGALLGNLPPAFSSLVGVLAVAAILGFVAYKLGRRLLTITELLKAFTLRGHWYLMPLVVVLLTVGSLLVVAASSPLVAPFIYTLF